MGYELMVGFLNAKGHTGVFDDMFRRLRAMIDRVLIVGYGIVGHNLSKELAALSPVVYDKYKGMDERVPGMRYDLAFICVDTPRTEDCPCDTSEVMDAILHNDAETFVIKSTVLPGTTDRLCAETGKPCVFSPEYYGGTQHANAYDYRYSILGGKREPCVKVIQKLQQVYDGRHTFRITDATTAELTKYMENAFLATKVSFCQQFFDIAQSLGVCYEELRELFVLDPRVNPSHTFVSREHPWWSSHCLDKDVPAIADAFDAPLIRAVVDYNESRKAMHE
jgi:UDP-glucose 6-dehydrogenase